MNNLRYYRKKADITLKELAEKAGLSVTGLSFIERGLRDTNGEAWKRMAKVLDCSLDKLLGIRNEE